MEEVLRRAVRAGFLVLPDRKMEGPPRLEGAQQRVIRFNPDRAQEREIRELFR